VNPFKNKPVYNGKFHYTVQQSGKNL
jgi:hypothetical protein